MKKKMLIVLLIIIGVIFIGTLIFSFFKKNVDSRIYIEYGEEFPNLEVTDNEGNMVSLLSYIEKDKEYIICYLSDHCDKCIENLKLISILINTKKFKEKYKLLLLWKDNIPQNRLDKNSIPNNINYSLNGKYSIADSVPYFYIIKNNEVNFISLDSSKVISKLFQGDDENNDIKNQIFIKLIEEYDVNKILFLTENCKECTEIYDYIINNNDNNWLIVTDYKSDMVYDVGNFYSLLFEIKQYPTLLSFNDDSIIIENDIKRYFN